MGIIVFGFFFFLTVLIGASYSFMYYMKRKSNKLTNVINTIIIFIFCLAWIISLFGLNTYSFDYKVAIDPIDNGYTPFSKDHFFTLIVYSILSVLGLVQIWRNGRNQPPLLLVIYISFVIVGIVICTFSIIQLSLYNDGYLSIKRLAFHPMMLGPMIQIVISIFLIVKVIRDESKLSQQRVFDNKWLNFLNTKLSDSKLISIWTFVVLLPVYLIITLVLIILGQDVDSMSKVFTETTTWFYSQKTHPPFLDHQGHYLCTVAACGSPNIVKPVRLGNRHGNEIIVNRQLMVANAFEDVIQRKYPRLHNCIRKNYDKYGYPLSKKINSKFWSNVTYILMKPLEWLFLIVLYLTCVRPEKLINQQYSR